MVDHQLAHSPAVKDLVNKSYDVGRDRPGKARTTDENPLIVESLGLDRDIKTWWHIDGATFSVPAPSTCSADVARIRLSAAVQFGQPLQVDLLVASAELESRRILERRGHAG